MRPVRRSAREALIAVAVAAVIVLPVLPMGSDVARDRSTVSASRAPARPASRSHRADPPPLEPTLQVVGLGDSVMAGTNCGCRTIPARLAEELTRRDRRPVHATNLGVAGYTTQDVITQLTEDPGARKAVSNADIIVLIIGANDLNDALSAWKADDCDRACYQPRVEDMRRGVLAILQLARALRAGRPTTVLVDNYWNVFTDGDVARADGGEEQVDWSAEVTAAANAGIADAAKKTGNRVVDLVRPFKHGGDDDPTPLLADDGDHPNSAGVDAIVDANLDAIPG